MEHIVSVAGGEARDWAAPIHLTCGHGHPLLVDARIVGLVSKGWPENERLQGLLGDGPSEIVDARREISLRLFSELSDNAYQLLLRLSSLFITFDRRLVEVVASMAPAISGAGALLDTLTGPWIEQRRADRYGLSPLLASASASLGVVERRKFHTAAIEDLITRSPFPGDLLLSLILYAMTARSVSGFRFIAQAVVSMPRHADFSTELFPLVYMEPSEDGLLVPEHAGVSAMLRTAQVIAAVNSDPPQMVEQIFAGALKEAEKLPAKLQYANTFANLLAVLGNEKADLAPKIWMPMLVSYHDHLTSGRFPAELVDLPSGVAVGGLTPEQMFFVGRSGKIDTVADVEELFGELEHVDPEWRHSLLTAASTFLGGPPLFVQKGWSSESRSETFDAAAAEAAYARMAVQTTVWDENEIAIECVRSRAVLFDEYLDQREDALTVLDDADKRFGRNERLVRSRATVLANAGRHEEALDLLSMLATDNYSADEPLERLMTLRATAVSAARVAEFTRSAQFFREAYAAATDETSLSLVASVRPGLLADAAIMEVQEGRLDRAVADLAEALNIVSTSASDDRALAFARAAIIDVIQWATARIERRTPSEDLSANPGAFSTLWPEFNSTEQGIPKLEPNRGLYLLARLEVLADVGADVQVQLTEREHTDGIQLRLATGLCLTRMERYIAGGDAGSVFALLPRFAWLSGLFARAAGTDAVYAMDDQISPDAWGKEERVAARTVLSGLVGMLIIDDCLHDAVHVSKQAAEMSPHLGALLLEAQDDPVEPREFFAAGIAALRLLRTNRQLNAEQLLHASIELFVWLRAVGVVEFNARVHRVLAERWLELARHRRVILSMPRVSAPAIETAATVTPSIGGIARLIEAGRLGSSLRLPDRIVAMLAATR